MLPWPWIPPLPDLPAPGLPQAQEDEHVWVCWAIVVIRKIAQWLMESVDETASGLHGCSEAFLDRVRQAPAVLRDADDRPFWVNANLLAGYRHGAKHRNAARGAVHHNSGIPTRLIRIDNAKDFIARGAPDETEGGFCTVGIELARRENERGIGH